MAKNEFFLMLFLNKMRQKLTILILFAKLQTSLKAPIPFLTTILDSLYENSTKLFLGKKFFFFCDVIFKQIRQNLKTRTYLQDYRPLGRRQYHFKRPF